MTPPSTLRQQIISGVLIAMICVIMFLIALVAVPKISNATGYSEDSVSWVAAIIAFFFTIGSGLWVRSIIENDNARSK